jgi:hypothetical protein
MSRAGGKLGPGPAARNLRDTKLHLEFRNKSSMAKSTREVGDALPSKAYPSAAHYHIQETQNTVAQTERYRARQKFGGGARVIDFIKAGEGHSELI